LLVQVKPNAPVLALVAKIVRRLPAKQIMRQRTSDPGFQNGRVVELRYTSALEADAEMHESGNLSSATSLIWDRGGTADAADLNPAAARREDATSSGPTSLESAAVVDGKPA
jgi:hypothetical protein